jgi:HK97 family phage prohead protease
MKETKYISLREFKATQDGAGGFKGYVTKFGELDDVGDIILSGAYTDTIAQFLKRGFTADSHDWSFGGGMIGYPVSAKEDKIGLLCETKFHSTPDAQAVRTKAQERAEAGLDTFLSIGYELDGQPITVYSADYASELAKYSSGDLLQQNMAKAAQFRQVRVIPKVHLYEYSLVTVPALESAMLTGVKNGGRGVKQIDIKGAFEAAMQEQEGSLWFLCCTLIQVLEEIDMAADVATDIGATYDTAGTTTEALAEFSARVQAAMAADDDVRMFGYDVDAETGTGGGGPEYMARFRELGLTAGFNYERHLKAVTDAAKDLIRRTEKRRELLVKEGRMLSSSNESMLGDLADSLDGHAGNIRKLLDSNQKPDPAKSAEVERERKLKLDEMERWFIGNIVEVKTR